MTTLRTSVRVLGKATAAVLGAQALVAERVWRQAFTARISDVLTPLAITATITSAFGLPTDCMEPNQLQVVLVSGN